MFGALMSVYGTKIVGTVTLQKNGIKYHTNYPCISFSCRYIFSHLYVFYRFTLMQCNNYSCTSL